MKPNTGEFVKAGRDYIGADADKVSDKVVAGLVERLSERGVSSRVFWWYMRSKDRPGQVAWRNYILSDKFWDRFDEYLKDAPSLAEQQASIELRTLERELRYWEDPVRVFDNKHISAGPLARFLMGNYLGVEGLVEKYRAGAIRQLLERPWFFKAFGKLRDHFPVTWKEVSQ